MTDDAGKSRCFGFVCFSTIEEASRALAEMNGQLITGQHLYVALAQPKAVRQVELERARLARLGLNPMGLGMGGQAAAYPPVMPGGMMAPQLWAAPTMAPPIVQGGRGGRGNGRSGPGRPARGRNPLTRGRGGPGGRGVSRAWEVV